MLPGNAAVHIDFLELIVDGPGTLEDGRLLISRKGRLGCAALLLVDLLVGRLELLDDILELVGHCQRVHL